MLGEDEPAASLSAPMSAESSSHSSPMLAPSPVKPAVVPSLGISTPVRQPTPARGMPGVVSQTPVRTPGRAMPGSARRAASTPTRPSVPPGFGPGTYQLTDFN